MNEQLKKRLLSLLWRAGLAAIVSGISILIDDIPDLGLPEFATVLTIMVLNEITKLLNNKYHFGSRLLGKKINS